MKRLVLASLLAFSFGASAYSVNMEQLTNFGNQMRDRFSPPHEIHKANNTPTCFASVTNEKTGKITRTKLELVGEHSQKGTQHTYHEEDNTGSTTVWFDSRTGKGQISIMDSQEVIASGTVSNCK
ncbi:TPA: hypothetical protein R4S75_003042 [Enterobacter hormaechei subsp. hoffmannii]|uniref:hypothetical protein n=1 Tax=Enterobacter TaxID=547 RepID=UPI0012FED595|nr:MULTISPECIES: hypothetical protein [Enterobacter]HED1260558.1 hypothetical protein [Enterobacter hormaechei subsp. hoffmannii]MDU2077941.1 hypothetical protein [Enterobacter sp.]HED1263382.1 hypothetical protein [Enterobacter hormaechei subsp. hoffmannii]HED1268469.1 hypothetical protein [Enterobacter hormaechei subsp. hoffmannii]HED1319713.1 hypothetical protein [Enterobacter hormaechei subsp. hoffmannii]